MSVDELRVSATRLAIMKTKLVTVSATLSLALVLTGCIGTVVPKTQISGRIGSDPFSITTPKDSDVTDLDITRETNGSVRVHIGALKTRMNPEVITTTGDAQAKLVQAGGDVAVKILSAVPK